VQDRQAPPDVFVGRAAELARVAEVITRVKAGQPWLVAIEGDPGGREDVPGAAVPGSGRHPPAVGVGHLPGQADRERRLLTGALHLTLAEEARGLALRPAVEETAPSPLRSCVLGTIALSSGQLGEAEQWLSQALEQARADPGSQLLAATIADRLAGAYMILGAGQKVQALARWALGTGCLGAAQASQSRALIAISVCQVAGPREDLAELSGETPPAPAARCTPPGCCWPTAGCCG
jgi:hypothetical protein